MKYNKAYFVHLDEIGSLGTLGHTPGSVEMELSDAKNGLKLVKVSPTSQGEKGVQVAADFIKASEMSHLLTALGGSVPVL